MQYETTGGGIIYTPDGKKLTKQVYVLTDPNEPVSPQVIPNATITSAEFVDIGGSSRRVTVTWTEGQTGVGSSNQSIAGSSTEVIGGSREIPVQAHPIFQNEVSESQRLEITKAISENKEPDTAIVPTDPTDKSRILYNLLFIGTEYYLAPAVSYRETTIESAIPNLQPLCTVNAPANAPTAGAAQNWLLTSINTRSVASPTGPVNYEVTREWMLSDRNGWDVYNVLYTGASSTKQN